METLFYRSNPLWAPYINLKTRFPASAHLTSSSRKQKCCKIELIINLQKYFLYSIICTLAENLLVRDAPKTVVPLIIEASVKLGFDLTSSFREWTDGPR